jgi:hypothetical protein
MELNGYVYELSGFQCDLNMGKSLSFVFKVYKDGKYKWDYSFSVGGKDYDIMLADIDDQIEARLATAVTNKPYVPPPDIADLTAKVLAEKEASLKNLQDKVSVVSAEIAQIKEE